MVKIPLLGERKGEGGERLACLFLVFFRKALGSFGIKCIYGDVKEL